MSNPKQPDPAPKTDSGRRWLQALLSYSVAAACLFWVFHDINFHELLHSLEKVHWWWVPVSIVPNLLAYVCAAWEWEFLLRPVGRVPLLRLTQAVFAGRFANDVLPVHVGYLIRLYLVSRWMQASLTKVIPSLLVERLFDGGWLALGIGVTALFVSLPNEVLRTGEILGGLILFGGALIGFVTLRRRSRGSTSRFADESGWKPIRKIVSFVERMVEGVRQIGKSGHVLAVLLLSLLKLLIQGAAFLTLLWAYGFNLPFWVQAAVFLVATVGISLPSTPAGAGVFQLFCVAGLTLFGVPKAAASGFALLAFVTLTLPLSIAGFLALAQSGMTLRQIRQEIEQVKKRVNNKIL